MNDFFFVGELFSGLFSSLFIVSSGGTFIHVPPRSGLDGSGHTQEVNLSVCVYSTLTGI